MKYFILGSFASAILLMGFAFFYATTGAMTISGIMAALAKQPLNMWTTLGAGFTIFGLGFKLNKFQIDYALTDIGDRAEALYSHVFSLKASF